MDTSHTQEKKSLLMIATVNHRLSLVFLFQYVHYEVENSTTPVEKIVASPAKTTERRDSKLTMLPAQVTEWLPIPTPICQIQ